MRARKLAAIAGMFAALIQSALAAPTETRGFRDWLAGCDNGRTCTALSLPAEGAETPALLRLERPAGPQAEPVLVLRIRGDGPRPPASLQAKLDGTPFPSSVKPLALSSTEADAVTITFDAVDTAALVAAARKASKLALSTAGKTYEVSLAGAVAAMLWIDEQQGRLNTTSALIRKGTQAAVPAAPPLPVVSLKPAPPALDAKAGKSLAAALRRHLKRLDADLCEESDASLTEADTAWMLDSGRNLVGLSCSRGAYNLSTAFWIVPGGNVTGARPQRFPQGDGTEGNILTNAAFDPRTGRLGFFAKGRGLGDCGVMGGYAWTGTGFVQTDLSQMDECRGVAPEDWITLYRSELKMAR